MITVADPDTHKPLKYNILYLFLISAGRYDIITMYEILREVREMPDDRHKYQGIEQALKQLDKEGFALHKALVKGVAYYSASPQTILKITQNLILTYKGIGHKATILENEIQFTDNVYEKLGHGSYLGIDNTEAPRLREFGNKIENWYYIDKHGHIKKTQQ